MKNPILASLPLLALAGGCSQPSPANIMSAQAQRALAIADEYKAWGRVDDDLRWAPFLCRQPLPGVARQSASADTGTHGQKLYSVWVKDHAAYPDDSKVGQVVVKESFKAEEVNASNVPEVPLPNSNHTVATDDHFFPYAKKGDKYYKAGDPAGLFIMYRVEPGPDNDEGWIYATVSPDKQVTASGRIDSCMGCHVEATHGRLFGVPKSPDGT